MFHYQLYRICLDIIVKIGYNHPHQLDEFQLSARKERRQQEREQIGSARQSHFAVRALERANEFFSSKNGEGHYTGDSSHC